MKKNFFIFFILFYTISIYAQDAPAVYKFEKGKSYKYLLEWKMDMSQEISGQTININVDATVTTSLNILDILPNGNFKCKTTFENALIMIESQQGTQTMGKDLAGKAFEIEIKPNGETIRDTSLLKSISPQDMQIVVQVINMLPKLSGKSVSVGISWTEDKTDTTMGMGKRVSKSKTNYNVKEKKQVDAFECFAIEMSGESETSGAMQQGGVDLNINGEGKTKGTILFAVKEGILVQMTSDEDVEQTITVPSQQNMRIPMTQHTTTKIELVK